MKAVWWIVIIVIIALGAYLLLQGDTNGEPSVPGENGEPAGEEVSILDEFDNKIVYTTEIELDSEPFQADCQDRGGVFNSCGTICEPNADTCAEVCAYTCELPASSGAES